MIQIKPFSDKRLDSYCSYCGQQQDTKDHVPSKILLDTPFPENLPVVPCCDKCNQGFSLDEEYFACLIECIVCGTTDLHSLKREKIRNLLPKNTSLHTRLSSALVLENGHTAFKIEEKRVYNVLLKLAKGHLKYENSEPVLFDPESYWFQPLGNLKENELNRFLNEHDQNIMPEIGSRAMQKVLLSPSGYRSMWNVVQDNTYQYHISNNAGSLSVKMIIWNYLAAEFTWN